MAEKSAADGRESLGVMTPPTGAIKARFDYMMEDPKMD
jgi:hypothetical protein